MKSRAEFRTILSPSVMPSSSVMMAVVLLVCFVSLANAQQRMSTDKQQKKHDLRRQVEVLEERWRKAQLAGDISAMDGMLADDFIGISMSGQVNTKAQQLERMRSRRLVLTRIDLSDMKVKLEGSVAIVTSQADVEGTNESQSMKGLYRYMRIYHREQNGDWKITHFEATRINPGHSAERKSGHPRPNASDLRTSVEPRFG